MLRRVPALLAGLAGCFLWAGGGTTASADQWAATTIDVVATPDGPQLVAEVDGGAGILVREAWKEEGRISFLETGNFGIRLAPGAMSRCRLESESDVAICDMAGLLVGTSSRKSLRFEMGPSGGNANASDSPLAIEAHGGPNTDRVTGSRGADLIDLGEGRDIVDGWDGDDLIDLGPGFDEGAGGEGDDRIDGGEGPDLLDGGSGTDLLIGGSGDDLLMAESNGTSDWNGPDMISDVNGGLQTWTDQPVDCGPGDDTVSRRSVEVDPMLDNCEHSLFQMGGAPLRIDGRLAVGATLTAERPPVGVDASYRAYRWLACESIDYGVIAHGCIGRGTCSSIRLGPGDVGRRILLVSRSTYTVAGGRFKVQPGDESVWTGPVGEESDAPLMRNDLSTQISGNREELHAVGYGQDRTGDPYGEMAGAAIEGQPCGSPSPSPTPASTPRPRPTPPAVTTPTPTPSATPTSSATPVPSAAPAPLTAAPLSAPDGTRAGPKPTAAPLPQRSVSSRGLAQAVVRALRTSASRALLRRRALTVAQSSAVGSVVRVQVRRGSQWLNVGVGRDTGTGVTVKFGPVGRTRLANASDEPGRISLRVLVRAPSGTGLAVRTTLTR